MFAKGTYGHELPNDERCDHDKAMDRDGIKGAVIGTITGLFLYAGAHYSDWEVRIPLDHTIEANTPMENTIAAGFLGMLFGGCSGMATGSVRASKRMREGGECSPSNIGPNGPI